jgi:hypothetical protein
MVFNTFNSWTRPATAGSRNNRATLIPVTRHRTPSPTVLYLLLGREETPLKLSIEQVGELVEYLEKWLDEGRFVRKAPELAAEPVIRGPHRRPAPTAEAKDPDSCAVDSH